MLSEYQTERIIEVGPTDTLTNMVKRTRDLKYRQHDAANSVQRRFLSSKRDRRQIYHAADKDQDTSMRPTIVQSQAGKSRYLAIPSAPKSPDSGSMKRVPLVQVPVAAVIPQSEPAKMAPLVPVVTVPTMRVAKTVPDVPVRATEIVRTVVACSLKKDPKEVSFSGTIKGLSGGQYSTPHSKNREVTDRDPRQIYDSE